MDLKSLLPAIYFCIQGLCGLAWWMFIFLSAEIRSLFLPEMFPDKVLLSLVIADMIFVVGSLYAGWVLVERESPKVCWFLVGATAYATLTCWGWTLVSGEAIAGSAAMTLALIGTTWATLGRQT